MSRIRPVAVNQEISENRIMKRSKRILFMVSINLLILGIGVAIAELIFGGWINEENVNRLNLIRDCTLEYDASELYSGTSPTIKYSRDKHGLRGSHETPGQIDILTVGGSTTDQRYIGDGETWQDVLQNQFSQSGQSIVIANAGVDGQSTYGHIKNFEWWFPNIPGLSPKYILFYVGLNDFYKEAGGRYDRLGGEEQHTLMDRIEARSAIWHLVRTLHGTYKAMVVNKIGHRPLDFSEVQWTNQPVQDNYDFMERRLKEYASRLRILAKRTKDLGASPIFVSQPSCRYRITKEGLVGDNTIGSYDSHTYNGVDYYYMMKRLDSITEAVALEKNAIFVDLASHSGWVESDFYDFEHMTPAGAKKVGVLLHEALKERSDFMEQDEE